MKRILVLLIIFSNIAFSEIVLDKSKSIPIKYAPTSVTVDGEGNIYSVSSFIGMVVKYNKEWKHEYTLKFKDTKIISDIFYYKDLVYVLLGQGVIVIIDKDGNIKNELDFPKGKLLGELNAPNGIYVDKDGIYLCDTGNSRIITMDFNGENLKEFGYKTVFVDGFVEPNGISKLGEYYVIIDGSTKEIKLFDKDGFYVGNIKNQEKEENFLMAPEDVYVDKDNTVYVVDGGTSQIQVFSTDGKIKSIGEKGTTKNKFYNVKDIWVDDKYIYVADTMNKSVKILDKKDFTVIKVLSSKKKTIFILVAILIATIIIVITNKIMAKKKGEVIE